MVSLTKEVVDITKIVLKFYYDFVLLEDKKLSYPSLLLPNWIDLSLKRKLNWNWWYVRKSKQKNNNGVNAAQFGTIFLPLKSRRSLLNKLHAWLNPFSFFQNYLLLKYNYDSFKIILWNSYSLFIWSGKG